MRQEILEQLKNENATPAYVFDTMRLQKRVSYIMEALKMDTNIELCYAMKANPFLIEALDSLVDSFEVCSPGELSICKKKNIAMDKIVLSGVNKEKGDVKRAMIWGVELYTIESKQQLVMIQECAFSLGIVVKALVRLTSGNQFGADKNEIREMLRQRTEFPNVDIKGIQYYSGTQKKCGKIVKEIEELLTFCEELEREFQITIERLEYGPGFGVEYFGNDDQETLQLDECKEAFKTVAEKRQLILEMGRFLAADCGSYITEIVDTKCNDGQKYCIVDGGINHVNYYGQVMGVRVPPVYYYRKEAGQFIEVNIQKEEKSNDSLSVCGSLCTTADVLVRSIPITDVRPGDMFVFEKIGAYSVTEGIYLFLSRNLPRVYLLNQNGLALAREAYETYKYNC